MEFRCDAEVAVWGPHPGCAEFMSEPEVFQCGQDAVARATWWQLAESEDGSEPTWEKQSSLLCTHHNQEEANAEELYPDPFVQGYECYFLETKIVAVYDIEREYGGPEEGGWWFDTGELERLAVFPRGHEEAAERVAKLYREGRFKKTHKRYSVRGGQDYDVWFGRRNYGKTLEEEYPDYFPAETQHYE